MSYPATELPRPEDVTTHANWACSEFSEASPGQARPYPATPALPPTAHPKASLSRNSGTPVRRSSHRWWYASRNRCCPAMANANAKKHTRPHTETSSGTASTKHTTTDRRLSNRVMVRNGRNARSARSARNALGRVPESSPFASVASASATTPPYPTITTKRSKRFHGSRAYLRTPATAHRDASSTVKNTFRPSSSASKRSFQADGAEAPTSRVGSPSRPPDPADPVASNGRYSASDTQLQKMAHTTSASKSSCPTTRAESRRRRVLVLATRRRQEDLRGRPRARLFRGGPARVRDGETSRRRPRCPASSSLRGVGGFSPSGTTGKIDPEGNAPNNERRPRRETEGTPPGRLTPGPSCPSSSFPFQRVASSTSDSEEEDS